MTHVRPMISGLLATALALSGAMAQAAKDRYDGPYQVGLTPEQPSSVSSRVKRFVPVLARLGDGVEDRQQLAHGCD